LPYKDKEVRNTHQRARHAKLRAENPEWVAKQKADAADKHRRNQATNEAYRIKRKADFAKWYAEFGKENARERKGYRPAEEYLAECEAKRKAKAEYMRTWYQTSIGQRSRVQNNIKKCGITIDQYDRAYDEQCGKCLICNTWRDRYTKDRLSVDHCHTSGAFRGLLCDHCNTAIGLLGESEEMLHNAIAYLQLFCQPKLE